MGEEMSNFDKGAREVADLVKEGDTDELTKRLQSDAAFMGEDFQDFLEKVDQFNQQDQDAGETDADLVISTSEMEGTEVVQSVEVETPGRLWGTNSEQVYDAEHGSGMIAHVGGLLKNRQAMMRELTGTQEAPKYVEQRKR